MPKSPERLEDLAASWRRHLRAAGLADRSIRAYGQPATYLTRWLVAHDRPPTVESLTRRTIETWLAELAVSREPGTLRTYYKGLHRFCRWLVDEGELDASPMSGMPVPGVPDKPVAIVTDDEITALLKVCSGKDLESRRDEAMIRVLLDTGMRVSELSGLRMDDVDLDQEVAIVMGKGRRPRACPFGAKTARAVDRYIRQRRDHPHARSERLWLSQRGPMSATVSTTVCVVGPSRPASRNYMRTASATPSPIAGSRPVVRNATS